MCIQSPILPLTKVSLKGPVLSLLLASGLHKNHEIQFSKSIFKLSRDYTMFLEHKYSFSEKNEKKSYFFIFFEFLSNLSKGPLRNFFKDPLHRPP